MDSQAISLPPAAQDRVAATRLFQKALAAMRRPLALFIFIAVLTGCSTYSSIREKSPKYGVTPGCSEPLAGAEITIIKAQRCERRDPLAALGGYISAAQISLREYQSNPRSKEALRIYDFAVGRIVEVIDREKLDPWSQPLRVPTVGGEFLLSYKADPRPHWNPALYTFTPADQFDVHGTYVKDLITRPGLGAPVVAIGKEANKDARKYFAMSKVYYGVTAIALFDGKRCVLRFEDPLATETVRIDSRTYPLGADFTVPIAVSLAKTNPKKLEITRLLNPGKYAETARLVRLQPCDPNKTVVLVIHGLMDTPATWTLMINRLRGDPEFRSKYQVWFYSYPSGYPYPYSAALLRHDLDGVEKIFPTRKPMVVIGHSMGGCISRLLITDTDDKLWLAVFGKKPADTPLSAENKALMTDALIFKHRPEIGRVIFISSPLKGSDLATHWLGRIGSSLVHSPTTLLQAGKDVSKIMTFQTGELKVKTIPNSVDTLAPNNRFVKAINTIPITPGIPYHTIIGDQGKGNSPKSSDGVVPYWSSHMDGAKSELIVPSGHGAHQNPKAIEEVHRILMLHAD